VDLMRELSHPIATGMQVYPGDPTVAIEPALKLASDGVDVAALHLGSHTGTHMDAPSHCVAGGRTTGQVGLHELVADALVVHLGRLPARATYGMTEIAAALDGGLPDRLPPIVVLDTGWAAHFGTAAALDHPALSADAAAELLRRGLHVLAVDTLSPDPTPFAGALPVHQIVLGADALIVENLCGIEDLDSYVRIGFFPLPIDADGAPVRAVVFD
jgi:kynurenine formamidase